MLLALFALLMAVGPLRAATSAPPEALARMGKGGVSLRWEARWLGPENGDVFLHLYVVPAGRASDAGEGSASPVAGPIEREEITAFPSLLPSPFFLDLFRRQGGKWKRLGSARFVEDKDVGQIVVRWLDPARRRSPVLLLRFGYGHWYEWIVIAFPQGLAAEPTVQRFLAGGESERIYNRLRFDGVDKGGALLIREDWGEEAGSGTRFYAWNGFEFRDPDARYFVIGTSTRTLAEAEAFVRREKLQDTAEIQPSDRYPRLRPGLFIVLLSRHRSQDEAAAMRKSYRKDGIPASVQTAF